MLWDLGVALLVWSLDRRYRFRHGRAFAVYVMAYVVGRFWIEDLRIDTANHILGLRLNDWTCLIVFIGAAAYFWRTRHRTDPPAPDTDLVTRTAGGGPEATA